MRGALISVGVLATAIGVSGCATSGPSFKEFEQARRGNGASSGFPIAAAGVQDPWSRSWYIVRFSAVRAPGQGINPNPTMDVFGGRAVETTLEYHVRGSRRATRKALAVCPQAEAAIDALSRLPLRAQWRPYSTPVEPQQADDGNSVWLQTTELTAYNEHGGGNPGVQFVFTERSTTDDSPEADWIFGTIHALQQCWSPTADSLYAWLPPAEPEEDDPLSASEK